MMWPTTSRVDQPAHAVGDSHTSGRSAMANIRSASARTTRMIVGLPSNVIAFHSLMRTPLSVMGRQGGNTPLLVEVVVGAVHQRIAEQLDLDAVGVLEVHRLLDA